ncbi:MAG: FliH/SctL family protein [Myxococcota bacterium]|nr:FliH/SctL family protein [Myxococcota bacterium]
MPNDADAAGGTVEGASSEDPLPSTMDELAALLDAAREEVRSEMNAELATASSALERERARVGSLVAAIETARSEWTSEVRSVLGELVVAGVRSVVCESADLQQDMLRDRFAVIGERLISEQTMVIRVRPDDADFAQSMIGDREGWKLVPDDSLSGGLVAETEGGRVDASLGSAITGLAESVQSWQDEGSG